MASSVVTATPSDATDAAPPPAGDQEHVHLQKATVEGKKKKSKSLAARGPTALPKNRGTGFEEYYAEPPLTFEEFEEEVDLYHPSLSFNERIETCIQRYRARRRLDNERSNIFNRYLTIGGVNCEPRQFNGAAGVVEEADGLSKDDKRMMAATDVIPRAGSTVSKYYASDNDHLWVVDFPGVAAGFLSVSLRAIGGSRSNLMLVGIDVVDNFLRYLQIHDVCPEYGEDVKAAREICSKAHAELPKILCAIPRMPGHFNLACTKLFCKEPQHTALHDGLDPLHALPNKDWDAMHIFRATLALQGTIVGQKTRNMAEHDFTGIHIVNTREVDLEITKLVPPSDDLKQRYASYAADGPEHSHGDAHAGANGDGHCGGNGDAGDKNCGSAVELAGVVIAKHCTIIEGYANQPQPSAAELASRGKEAFLLDANTMAMLCPGMKLRVVMQGLNCDLNFVSAVKEVTPSFYTFLPQELMMDWKEPRPNEREPPSVDNPGADEEAVQAMLDDDDKEA